MASPRSKRNGSDDNDKKSTVDWRKRMGRERLFGTIKLLLFVVVLGALTGLGIVYKNKIMAWLNPPVQTTRVEPKAPVPPPPVEVPAAPKAAPPPEAPKAPAPPPEAPKAPTPPPPEWNQAEDAKAKELLKQARESLSRLITVKQGGLEWPDFDFDGAKKRYEEAAQLKASPETHKLAVDGAKKANEFKLATAHIPVTEFATVPTTYVVTLTNGNTLRGLKIEENNDFLKLQTIPPDNPATQGKMKIPIPKGEIAEVTGVPLAERQSQFRQLLSQVESGVDLNGTDPRDLYDIVFLAKRLALGPELVEYLDKAASRAPDGRLGDAFRKLVVDRALERAALLAAAGRKHLATDELNRLLRSLPGYAVAQDEVDVFKLQVLDKIKQDFKSTITLVAKKEPAPQPTAQAKVEEPKKTAKELATEAAGMGGGEEILVDSSGLKAQGASAGKLAEANKAFEEGMKFYKQYKQGTKGNNNTMLDNAKEHLGKAVDLYSEILEKEPNNRAVEDRQTEANMIYYACLKYHTLDMGR
ncbi:MAG: hypothetical protein AMXMBFR7_31360 [Planctomycetota bacterium]